MINRFAETDMYDSHCHLEQTVFDEDRDLVVKRAKEAGIDGIVNSGNNPGDNRKVLALQEKYGQSWYKAVLAVSPHYAPKTGLEAVEEELDFISKNRGRIQGVGETGLDFFHFKEEKDRLVQRRAFEMHLQFAEAHDLAAVVHSRDAVGECLEIMKEFKCRKIMHCFLEHRFLENALEQDCWISLPTLKSKPRDKIIKKAPLENLLAETDSPWLWQPRNEPANVKEVYERVAEKRQIPLEKAEEALDSNARRAFGF